MQGKEFPLLGVVGGKAPYTYKLKFIYEQFLRKGVFYFERGQRPHQRVLRLVRLARNLRQTRRRVALFPV